jgi:lipopolysaccharide transport system ATP-binding protein
VDFSGISRFIDTPVKFYSSGMRVRLAFSVAAHLQPNILFVDEVLAVGDLEFQEKCIARMKEIVREGRTVLFVSHNLAAVREMCEVCVFIENGEIRFKGPVDDGLAMYFSSYAQGSVNQHGTPNYWYDVGIEQDGQVLSVLEGERPFSVRGTITLNEDFVDGELFFKIKDSRSTSLVRQGIGLDQVFSKPIAAGEFHVRVELPCIWLAPGFYTLFLRFTGQSRSGEQFIYMSPEIMFSISGSYQGSAPHTPILQPPLIWSMDCKNPSIHYRNA